jgi:BirA family transcriptional regulator, biotin operon repressor / biotin---[acetyl-CoA-carboxylase] ligase
VAALKTSVVGSWTVHHYPVVDSSNLVAASLPGWHAVRADSQTTGRGRFQRAWVSDPGGLWLSAVLPVAIKSPLSRILPLAVGVAVCTVLHELGVTGLRLRWPNDVLVQDRKVAGLLIDHFVSGLSVVGIGLNVRNRPEDHDPRLLGSVARLADFISPSPDLSDLTRGILASLEAVWKEAGTSGPDVLLPRINALWQAPRTVCLELDSSSGRQTVEGEFTGVDADGRLKLRATDGGLHSFEPNQVKLLRDS